MKEDQQLKIQTIYETTLSYCLKCRKNTESKNSKVARTKNGRVMLLSKCTVCDSRKSTARSWWILKQSKNKKIFEKNFFSRSSCFNGIKQVITRYTLNEIVNNFLIAGDKFMLKMHLRQPGFTYSACGPFTENKERMQKFKVTGDSRYIYQN